MMMMLEHASTHKTHAYLPVFFLFIIRLRLYSTSLPDFKSLPKLGSNNCSCEVSECEWCTLQFKFNDTYKRSSQRFVLSLHLNRCYVYPQSERYHINLMQNHRQILQINIKLYLSLSKNNNFTTRKTHKKHSLLSYKNVTLPRVIWSYRIVLHFVTSSFCRYTIVFSL